MHPLSTQRLAPVPSASANHQRALLPPSPLLLRPRTTNTRSSSSARSAPRAISPVSPTTAATNDPDAGAQSDKWAGFAARVSGEWDGFGAEFTVAGEPVELPANVVPDAYREWGVQVLDWQTECPTLADPAAPGALHYRLVRLLPTVDCEADATAVHTSHQRHASSAAAFAYAGEGGSYVATWPKGPAAVLEVEHCICHPDNAEVRVRLVQTVALAKDAARLRGLKVFSEQWYGPYRNGDQLGGCALRESAFAAGERLAASAVAGQWESTARSSGALDPITGKLAGLEPDHEPRRTARDGAGSVTLLPKQLWSSLKVSGDGDVVCEVGWLLGHGSAVTSTCVLSRDGDVKEIAAAQETRVSEAT
ncbi:hypothetical protein ZWY2020_035252 [Hordeum vulgare]|nr:hypothetical protein ZWY2020_035252 [Hordeum vulgare]